MAAEAFLRKYGEGQFEPFSAGLEPKGINPLTVRVMQEIGFDLSGYRSKGIDEFLGKEHFEFLVTLCHDAEENCPRIWPGVNQRLHWSFEKYIRVRRGGKRETGKVWSSIVIDPGKDTFLACGNR